ncbi:Protein of unknown function [Singulisphaera sp. GP187]|uniref:DUF551 domain-containing protein n=1 Tax=Singulisphaera sp. GP187 TaxID=1882752 RepID=UPI000927BE75|nr:DUF551 domain-containing protein [Singulisphaera sp. GP187]SIN70007.1 Protein of unknown function [Singulisphaera sp. GP187]
MPDGRPIWMSVKNRMPYAEDGLSDPVLVWPNFGDLHSVVAYYCQTRGRFETENSEPIGRAVTYWASLLDGPRDAEN